jgi:N-acetylglutamate synthase-like GNAT family acetyltransferase
MNMPHIEIIPYRVDYEQAVADLILTIQRDEFGIAITLEAQPDLQDIHGFYLHGNGNFWLAIVDGSLAGTIALRDIGNRQVALRKMFVKAAYRGSAFGVGQSLLNTAFEWAAAKRITDIFLGTTEKFVAAHRFYEKNGFVEIEKSKLPEAFPAMLLDVKFYRCQTFHLGGLLTSTDTP